MNTERLPKRLSRDSSPDDLKAIFPTKADFAQVFSCDMVLNACADGVEQTYITNPHAPTLSLMSRAYGEAQTKEWMEALILFSYSIIAPSMDEKKMLHKITDILYQSFNNERASVLALFLGKCMRGVYTVKYRSIEVNVLLKASNDFLNHLPKLKNDIALNPDKPADGEKKIFEYPYSYFSSVRSGSLWRAWRDSVLRLWRTEGIKAVKRALEVNNEYSCAIQGLIYCGALYLDDKGCQHYNNEAFEQHVARLDFDLEEYIPKYMNYHSF